MRARDWSRTSLGPVSEWPAALSTAVQIMLRSRFPMFLGWGPGLTMFYNDAYIPVLGGKHPAALGAPTEQVWTEIWDVLGPLARDVLDGRANFAEDLLLVMQRAGFEEETYFTFSYSPLPGEGAEAGGLFCACTETTRRVVGERRLATLRALGELSTSETSTAAQACVAAMEVLEGSRTDVPFATVYLNADDGRSARLVASYGVRVGPGTAPAVLPAADGGHSVWAAASRGETTVSTGLGSRYPGMIEPVPGAVGATPHDAAVIVPLRAGGTVPVGAITVGISPYRPLDEDYRAFVDLVVGHVETAIVDARAYEAERERATALAELDRAKSEFFANVSHEFRTPLTLMMGPIAELRADATSPLDRERLAMVHRNGLRLGRLVNNLLGFSRDQAGADGPARRPVDLAALTADLAAVFRSAVERAGLELVVDCPPLDGPVWVDPRMWETVLLNLLSNAVKYTNRGTITVRLRPGVVLTVADTGIGVPEHELPHLFERFHRVIDGRARSIEGSGIGLALTRQLVEAHRGTITADSTIDVGTTFTVTLPAGPPEGRWSSREVATETAPVSSGAVEPFLAELGGWLDPADHVEAAPTAADRPGSADTTPVAGRVLVVDDNADMRAYLTRLLSPLYLVDTAADGMEALAAARADTPDLILTDVMMPRLGGFELIAALRAEPATAAVPVVVVSARAGQEAIGEGLSRGADDYLTKPFSAADLLARVRSTLAMARLRSSEGAWRKGLLNALQDALVVVDARGRVVEINEAFAEVLGYGPEGLPYSTPYPWWPDPDTEPDEFAHVVESLAVAQKSGGRFLLAQRHRDGRKLWVEASASIVADPNHDGSMIVGVFRDVTDARRAAQRDRLLAEAGDILAGPGGLTERLAAFTSAATEVLTEQVLVSLVEPDGRYRPVALARRGDPEAGAAALALAPHHVPAGLRTAYEAGRAFVLPVVTDELPVETSEGAADPAAGRDAALRSGIVVPLVVAGRPVGSVSFGSTDPSRMYDEADLALADELGRRVAAAVHADRVADREHRLHTVTAALSEAATLDAAAEVLSVAVTEMGAAGVAVYVPHPDDAHPHLIHSVGYPPEVTSTFDWIPVDTHLPVARAARTRTALWLGDQRQWRENYPKMAVGPDAELPHALAVLPLISGDRVVGVLAASYPTSRAFPPDERAFVTTLAGLAAAAFDRAAVTDEHARIAQTLQRSLLPARLPTHPRLALAARYEPAGTHTQAGGDWYDVIALDEHRVAIAVGDVVGNGPAAAAVMGQLRSALAGFLLESHAPARALTWLSRFAWRVDGARGSTVICLVLHTGTGELRWARAGHPPPLLLDAGTASARLLEDAHGIVLGVTDDLPYVEGRTVISPGASVLLYTDGLVERRGEAIDVGFERLLTAATRSAGDPPDALIRTMRRAGLDDEEPADDVALIVARLLPAPLHLRLPAVPEQLPGLRRVTREWASAAALSAEHAEDLQLAVGEAVTNAVEHAYLDHDDDRGPPEFTYRLDRTPEGAVRVHVGDQGTWRTPPLDPGYRGRGLAMIKNLAADLDVDTTGPGTLLRFTVAAPAGPAQPRRPPLDSDLGSPAARDGPGEDVTAAGMRPQKLDGTLVLHLSGDLDLASVPALRPELLDAVRDTPGEILVDTSHVTHLASAGVHLLIEAFELAPERLTVVVDPGTVSARVLAATGLDRHLHIASPGS